MIYFPNVKTQARPMISSALNRKLPSQEEKALRQLAGRAIHRPTDLGMKDVVALASALIGFLEEKDGKNSAAAPSR